MSLELLTAWFVMMFPIVFSPGPANVTFAATGARYGFRNSLPLLLGVNTMMVFYALFFGFGAGKLFELYPQLVLVMKYLSSAYLCYLAYKFYQSRSVGHQGSNDKAPGFWDGVLLQIFNVKAISMFILMFSVFASTDSSPRRIFMLVLLLSVLNIFTHTFWISASSWLGKKFHSEAHIKMQNNIFALMLVGVAIWMLI